MKKKKNNKLENRKLNKSKNLEKIDNIYFPQEDASVPNKAPAKKNIITIKDKDNINVKYNTKIEYNEGDNQMEKNEI